VERQVYGVSEWEVGGETEAVGEVVEEAGGDQGDADGSEEAVGGGVLCGDEDEAEDAGECAVGDVSAGAGVGGVEAGAEAVPNSLAPTHAVVVGVGLDAFEGGVRDLRADRIVQFRHVYEGIRLV